MGAVIEPDGNLWFTLNPGALGRITPEGGAITLYPLPRVDARPMSIIATPGNALWFTEMGANAVGRVVLGKEDLPQRVSKRFLWKR